MTIPIEQALAFMKDIADRWGMKSFVTGGVCWLISEMAKAGQVDGLYALMAITIIVLAFFLFRDRETNGQSCCGCEEEEVKE